MSDAEIASTKVKLRANGDLNITEDGVTTLIAQYSKASGKLEFITKEFSVKYYNQVLACIGTVAKGTEPSNNLIKSINVKGEAAKVSKDAPKRPKMGPLGDSAEDIVQYYLDHDLPQAIIRYGIYTDAKGAPIRKRVKRTIVNIADNRNLDDRQLTAFAQGANSETKGPVNLEGEIVEATNAIIARRATALTYTPNEVVGGFVPDDEFEPAVQVEDEN